MLDARKISLVAEAAAPLPIERMVLGKPRAEVAEMLPCLFNLCRAAQSMAVRLALGLPTPNQADELRREILRDHVLRLSIQLPGHFGHSPTALPSGWQEGGAALRPVLFGPAGQLPRSVATYEGFLRSGEGVGALWAQVASLFGPGEAVAHNLPWVSQDTAFDRKARVENSCAQRVADHPVVAHVERHHGRGPLWRLVARSYDLEAILDGAELRVRQPNASRAQVPATRGLYSVEAACDADRVTAFARVTPTDHLRAKGGVLDQSLASLPAARARLAPLLMDILDPCAPIRVTEASHA